MERDIKRWETPISNSRKIYCESINFKHIKKVLYNGHTLYFYAIDKETHLIHEFIFIEPGTFLVVTDGLGSNLFNKTEIPIGVGTTFTINNSKLIGLLNPDVLYGNYYNSQDDKLNFTDYFIDTNDKCLEVVTDKIPIINTYTIEEYKLLEK